MAGVKSIKTSTATVPPNSPGTNFASLITQRTSMSKLHISVAALLVAVGELLTAIGQKNPTAFYANVPPSGMFPAIRGRLANPAQQPRCHQRP